VWSADLAEIGAEDWSRQIGIGVDPGKNYGISYVSDLGVFVYNGEMPDAEHQDYGVMAYNLIREVCDYHCLTHGDVSIVEGASYGSVYGQVGLAEIRFGFYLGLLHTGLVPRILAPASIRKAVFGNGKTNASELWPILNGNGAASLSVALAGTRRTQPTKEDE